MPVVAADCSRSFRGIAERASSSESISTVSTMLSIVSSSSSSTPSMSDFQSGSHSLSSSDSWAFSSGGFLGIGAPDFLRFGAARAASALMRLGSTIRISFPANNALLLVHFI